MQNDIAVAVDLSPSPVDAQRQEAYDVQEWNHVTASDAACIALDRKPAENTCRKALNSGKSSNRMHFLTCFVSVKIC